MVLGFMKNSPPIQLGGSKIKAGEIEVGEPIIGETLGAPLTKTQAKNALERITRNVSIKKWAGEVLSADETDARLNIKPGTTEKWRKERQVISLPQANGSNDHQYPFEQFQGRGVLRGIAEIIKIQPLGIAAWQWLRTPHEDFDGDIPLNALRRGKVKKVRNAAVNSFG